MLYGCTLLYIALIYVRPAEIVPGWETIPFVDILTAISAIVAIFSFASKPRPFLKLPHDKFVIAFWLIIAISSFKIWMMGVLYAWLAFVPAVACYLLIRAAVQTGAQLRGVVYLLILLNTFLAVNGIIQYHTGIGLGNVTTVLDRIYGTGIFNDPNDLGMTFVMSVPLILLVIGQRGALVRAAAVVALMLVLLAAYYTNSRGAIVGVAAVFVSLSFFKYRPGIAWLTALVLVGVITVAAPSRGSEISFDESSAQTRIQSWAAGWAMLKVHPLTGVGYDQYTEHHYAVAHNSFVHTFAELGLLGALCFVGIFYWYFKGLVLIPKSNTDFAPWRRALLASAAGTLACSWFLSRQYIPVLYTLAALGASAADQQIANDNRPKLQMGGIDAVRIAALTMALLLVVYVSIRTMAIWGG